MPPTGSPQSNWYEVEIRPHEPKIRAWLANRFGLNGMADDILQEALLRAVKAHEQGSLHSPKSFLYTTARNLAIDHLRKNNHSQNVALANLEGSNVIPFEESIPETVARNQELSILNEAIASLPEKCREIFSMRRIHGLSQMEIAERLGISRNTVSAQLTIGLRKCTEYFDQLREEKEDRINVVR